MSARLSADELAAVEALLREAGRREVMPRFRRLPDEAIRTKSGPQDLVTDADEAAERWITAGLQSRFPGCVVVGEEAAAADPSLLRRLAGPGLAFVVDPIDGTANYAAGLPLFGVMAAALAHEQVIAAVIHDPVLEESCLALRDQGAWSVAPGHGRRALQVSAPAPLAAMTGTLSWRYLSEPRRSRLLQASLTLAGAWDFRCAAHHYRLLADGKCHFSLYHRLLPWDHAPGWLLHREAGGHAAGWDGQPYHPLHAHVGLLCAPDQASWSVLHRHLA